MTQAALTGEERRPRLWRDLNVFLASFAALSFVAGFAVSIPLSMVMKLVLPSRQAELVALPLGYALVALVLGWRWWKHGLSPRQLDPARHSRFRWGHGLLAFFNLAMAAMFLTAWLGTYSGLSGMPAVAEMVMGLMALAPMALLVGLIMVLSAGGTAPAFADTLPAAPGAPRQAPSAKWPPEAARAGSAPSKLVVLAGLVVSGFIVFIGGVFAAIGFAYKQELLFTVVVPILVVGYALYATAAIVLFAKRRAAAMWVAWAPVIFLTVVVPAGQMIMMLIR